MFGHAKPARPSAVAFDVLGTLFPLVAMRAGVVKLGLPPSALEGWYAAGVRDALALATVAEFKPFATVMEGALVQVLAEQNVSAAAKDRAALLKEMENLPPRPEAGAALELLASAGVPALAVSNGSASATKSLLKQAGLDQLVQHVVSADEVKLSKPRPEVYERAAKVAQVEPKALAMVAAHPWDLNGAKAAGLVTAFVSGDRPYPETMHKPDVEGRTLTEAVQALLDL